MGFYFEVCEASCFLSIYRCGNDADSVLSPLIPPLSVPPPQGSFPSTLESSRATRHHGLVERVQRDRRFVSPVRPYRKVSFSLREAPCLIPDCSCAPDFLSVCLLPVKTETSQLHFDCWELFSAADDQKSAAAAPGWSVE